MNYLIKLGYVGLVLAWASTVHGQANVRYNDVADPLLFLIREQAVWDELKLTPDQRRSLLSVTDRYDQPMLATRIASPERARDEGRRIRQETQDALETILKPQQLQRLDQISLRVRGVDCLQIDSVASQLALTDEQRRKIASVNSTAQSGVEKLAERIKQGEPLPKINDEHRQLMADRQRDVLALLTADQNKKLSGLLGAKFDPARLGHVRFKAPELVESGGWINSGPLRLADLRGQVTVLHFWTFG